MSDTEGPDADADADPDANSDGNPDPDTGGMTEEDADEMTADGPVDEDEMPEPSVQSEALRRQQLFVGSGVAAIAGIAVTVATLQQLPDVPFTAALAGGLVTSALLFALLYVGIFRGSDD